VRRVVDILDRQRADLTASVVATDRVVAELAARRDRVQDLIVRGADVTEATADHRKPLALAIRRLPPLLDEVQPVAARLDELTRDSTPVLRDLRGAAPDILRLVKTLPAADEAGMPALAALSNTAVKGRET